MNRAEKYRKKKVFDKVARKTKHIQSAIPSSKQQVLSIQKSLGLAVQHHNAGDLPKAESIYRKILQADPNQPEVLHLLGVIAHQVGKNDIAVDLITKAIAIKPDYAEAHSNMSNALKGLGKLDEAVASCQKAIAIKPDFAEAHSNLGSALKALGKLDEAVASYRKAIAFKPDYAEAYYNLGAALKDLGKLDEAVASYRETIAIKPDFAEAHSNLGAVLKGLGKLDEAVASCQKAISIKPDDAEAHYNLSKGLELQGNLNEAFQCLQSAFEKIPENKMITTELIDILDRHTQNEKVIGSYAKAQLSLKQVVLKDMGTPTITDDTVRQMYQQCHSILISHQLSDQNYSFQFWRGINYDLDCKRHKKIFDSFNVIPKFCFGCFKVSIKPRTVMELFKLMLIFDRLELPNDNLRKCLVEVRPEIVGTYTGLIYCENLDEGKENLEAIQKIVGEEISYEIPISLKRGCSEYSIAFPGYEDVGSNDAPMLTYNEKWLKHEVYTDKNLVDHKYPLVFGSYNHIGLTLKDVVVMQTWLAYAAAIGDLSYLDIFKNPMLNLPIEKRPPFQSFEDR